MNELRNDPDGLVYPEDVWGSLKRAESVAWITVQDKKTQGVTVASVRQYRKKKRCEIDFCGGKNVSHWLGHLPQLEEWARSLGCDCIVVPHGRPGWKKLLKGYTQTRVVLEKEL